MNNFIFFKHYKSFILAAILSIITFILLSTSIIFYNTNINHSFLFTLSKKDINFIEYQLVDTEENVFLNKTYYKHSRLKIKQLNSNPRFAGFYSSNPVDDDIYYINSGKNIYLEVNNFNEFGFGDIIGKYPENFNEILITEKTANNTIESLKQMGININKYDDLLTLNFKFNIITEGYDFFVRVSGIIKDSNNLFNSKTDEKYKNYNYVNTGFTKYHLLENKVLYNTIHLTTSIDLVNASLMYSKSNNLLVNKNVLTKDGLFNINKLELKDNEIIISKIMYDRLFITQALDKLESEVELDFNDNYLGLYDYKFKDKFVVKGVIQTAVTEHRQIIINDNMYKKIVDEYSKPYFYTVRMKMDETSLDILNKYFHPEESKTVGLKYVVESPMDFDFRTYKNQLVNEFRLPTLIVGIILCLVLIYLLICKFSKLVGYYQNKLDNKELIKSFTFFNGAYLITLLPFIITGVMLIIYKFRLTIIKGKVFSLKFIDISIFDILLILIIMILVSLISTCIAILLNKKKVLK